MRRNRKRLTLLLPGLSGTPARLRDAGLGVPRLFALERLHARAWRTPSTVTDAADLDTLLCSHFGLSGGPHGLPFAALRYLGLTGRQHRDMVIAADPVLLRAEQDRLLMLHADSLSIGEDEAQALVAHLNSFYAADGWRFEAPATDQWFLFVEDESSLQAQPLSVAVGHNINNRLPSGKICGRAGTVVINEIQMLLHDTHVNQAREADGRPPVNGVWLWGAGRLPARLDSPVQLLVADHPLARGLAALSGCDHQTLTEWDWANDDLSVTLMLVDSLHRQVLNGDLHGQHQALQVIERDYVGPALVALKKRRVDELVVDDGAHQLLLDRARLWRFWCRPREIER